MTARVEIQKMIDQTENELARLRDRFDEVDANNANEQVTVSIRISKATIKLAALRSIQRRIRITSLK